MNAKRSLLGMSLLSAGMVGLLLLAGISPAEPKAPPVKLGDRAISGPYVHENLAVFLIHGPDRIQGLSYLTLQEAMEKKLVIVHETGNVNQLSVENVGTDQDVYIQSGDIVKGGRQDRTIAMDFIVPPKSGKMGIDAFCVEHGRWRQRGAEPALEFSSSQNALAGRQLKLAAKQQADQSAVWQEAGAAQQRLQVNAGAVADSRSPSSFELSLESKAVQQHTDEYIKALQPAIDGKDDVIGYAFAINGKINSADIYAGHALFAKLWPKLLRSSAVEAVADLPKQKNFAPATADALRAFIADAQSGKTSEKDVTRRVQLVTRETDQNLDFETRDRHAANATIHENYVSKK